jgi:hypothetical protein
MANQANRAEDCDRYRHEEKLWLQIAEQLEARDEEATLECGAMARAGT